MSPRAATSSRATARRAARAAGWALVAVLGATGVVTAHTAVLSFAVLAGAMGALGGVVVAQGAFVVAQGAHGGTPARGTGVRAPWVVGALAGLAFVFLVAGLVVFLGPVTVPVVALAAGGWAWTRWRARDVDGEADDPDRVDILTTLTNAELGRAWRRSHQRLVRARDLGELERVCRLRRRQLDEMERRDPTGFRRWLGSGTWVPGDSAPFLGG